MSGPLLLRLAAAPAAGLRTVPQVDPDQDEATALSHAIERLTADPQLREAIAISSPSLSAQIDAICAGKEPVDHAKVRRALLATLRYALRLHLRPTPFGTFAGVSTARLGSHVEAAVGTDHRRHVRLDRGVVDRLRRESPSTLLVAQPLLTTRGNRLVNLAVAHQEKSVAMSPILQAVIDRAAHPVSVDDLAALVCTLLPQATLSNAHTYLDALRVEEFLLDGERPSTSVTTVGGLPEAITEYLDAPPTDRRERWDAACDRVADTNRTPLLVNLVMDARLTLPTTVAREVATAAEVLWKLAPDEPASKPLDAYHQRFLHRYGSAQLVPVLDLLDSHRGLGLPDGYQDAHPTRTGGAAPSPSHPIERDNLLADLVAAGAPELNLDQEAVESLTIGSERRPPRTFDLGVSLHADNADALARGDYLLACTNGSVSAGATIGRFADLLGVHSDLRALVDRGQADVTAELRSPTTTPRQGNVVSQVAALDAVVELGLSSEVEPVDRIALRDIAIGSDGHALYAVDMHQRRVIDLARLNMVNPSTALPHVTRFLSALSLGGRKMWSPWDWGRLAVLPSRPRVRVGKVILAGRQWRPPTSLLDHANSRTFDQAVERWCGTYEVPPNVRVATGDQRLDLDLDHPLHRALLREHLRRHPESVLEEAPDGWCAAHGVTEPHGLMDGHAAEVVFPILTPGHADRLGPVAVPWSSLSTTTVRHLPGGSWLSAKVYADANAHDRLISTGLDGLLEQISDATYVLRYADPDPHIRVRIPVADDSHATVLKTVNTWSNAATASHLIRTVAIDEYAPEIDRYGGADAMPAAETVFAKDTALARHLLATTPETKLGSERAVIAAASCLDLLQSFAETDVTDWILAVLPVGLSHAVPTQTRRAAHRHVLADFAELVGKDGADLVQARRHAATAHGRLAGPITGTGHSAAISLMHLHCNRYLGLSQAQEHLAYGLLRSAVSARSSRRQATS